MDKVIIIASGPSLCKADVDICACSDWSIIAVNSSWKLIPRCDVIYAGDYEWWSKNLEGINSTAELWSCSQRAAINFGLNRHIVLPGSYNSGLRAIEFAVWKGVRNIILLGYDASLKYGRHWHNDYVDLPNPTQMHVKAWRRQFDAAAQVLNSKSHIVNCSANTALTCFERGRLLDEVKK